MHSHRTISRRGLLGTGLALATLPAAARAASLEFLVVGDWGRGGADRQLEVGAQMGRTAAAIGSRFVVSVGDNFYEDGVTSPDDPQWDGSFEFIYSAPSLQIPWHAILGNHDYIGNVQAQIDYSARSSRWRMPARYFQRREHLSDGTPADFFYLDTNPFLREYWGTKVRVDGQDTAAQLAWLDAALAMSDAPWKIVIGHHPVHTVARERRDTPELIARLKPLLRKHRVSIYLNGHDHNLQYTPIDGGHWITSGAGSETNRVKKAEGDEFGTDQHGFMTVSLSAETFAFAFINESGDKLFEKTLPRQG